MKKIILSLLSLSSVPLLANLTFEGDLPQEDFLIRWRFQELCDHSYDPRMVWPTYENEEDRPALFTADQVQPGDLVFIRDCESFFREMHPHIMVPYFLLTHGEFLDTFEPEYLAYLDDPKILAWFTIHPCEFAHERVIPIPLGILQKKSFYRKTEIYGERIKQWREIKKDKLLYMNFSTLEMPWRDKIRDHFLKQPFCFEGNSAPFKEYMAEMAHFKFTLSPPGLGPDCYRNWESPMIGTIPIVQHSHLDYLYEGLPVLFINNWEEVTEEFLHNKYQEMSAKRYSQKILTMEYWIDRIDEVRKKFWPSQARAFARLNKSQKSSK